MAASSVIGSTVQSTLPPKPPPAVPPMKCRRWPGTSRMIDELSSVKKIACVPV
jgi:hypothetical protein